MEFNMYNIRYIISHYSICDSSQAKFSWMPPNAQYLQTYIVFIKSKLTALMVQPEAPKPPSYIGGTIAPRRV